MRIIAWVLVIWIAGSLVVGIKEDKSFFKPFKKQYEIWLEEHCILTLVVSVVVLLFLIKILF